MAAAIFRSGGLASGLDTNSIIDQLTKIEQQPIDALRTQQSAMKAQISTLGIFTSALSALDTATSALGTAGLSPIAVQGTHTSYSAAAGSTAVSGSFDLQVTTLASAAKARSNAFASSSAPVTGGTMHLTIDGKTTDLAVADGAQLSDVAAQINNAGLGVAAGVVFDGTNAYLTLANRSTGFATTAASALSATFDSTGTAGQAIAIGVTHAATNASFFLDGLAVSRRNNVVSDAIPGVSLTLLSQGGPPEGLTIARDSSTAQSRLQSFVDGYNNIASAVHSELTPAAGASRSGTLASDSTLRGLQSRLQSLISNQLSFSGGVRSLADLGLKTQKDGTLVLDSAALTAAIARDPDGVNAVFSAATTGVAAKVKTLVHDFVNPVSGLLVTRSSGLTDQIKQLDTDADSMQQHVDAYKEGLIAQFTALESIISGYKSSANFLTQMDAANSKK